MTAGWWRYLCWVPLAAVFEILPVEPGDLVLGEGGGDESLFAKVLGDLDHLGLLSVEGVLDVAGHVLDGLGLAVQGSSSIGGGNWRCDHCAEYAGVCV